MCWKQLPIACARADLSPLKINLEINADYQSYDLEIALKIGRKKAHHYQLHHNHQAENSCHNLVFALEKLLSEYLEIYALSWHEGSDNTLHMIAAATTWQQVRTLIGEEFEQMFIKYPVTQEFIALSTKTEKQIDWQKLWQYSNGEFREPFYKSFPDELRYLRADNLTNRVPTWRIFSLLSECSYEYLKDWYLQRDTNQLATTLYTYATGARVGALWDIFAQRRFPNIREGCLGFGMLIWAYFIYTALGAFNEASDCGQLLTNDIVNRFERVELRNSQPAYYDLALFLHNGSRGSQLDSLADMLPLLERANWQQPDRVISALKAHTRKHGEQYTHNPIKWTWPATLYALARRADAIDLLPKDNPFLNTPLELSMVDRNDEFLQGFLEMERNYRAIDAINLPPPVILPKVLEVTIQAIEKNFIGQPLVIGYTRYQSDTGEWFNGYRIEANPPDKITINIGEVWRFRAEQSKPKKNDWVLVGRWLKRIN